MRVGVIGGGTVGKAVARTYLEFVDEVRVYDVVEELCTHEFNEVMHCDIVFICVPEGIALDDVFTAVKQYGSPFLSNNYVLKSTVPVGTTRKLKEKYGLTNLIHSPEFLTSRCANADSMMPNVNVIGTSENRDLLAQVSQCEKLLKLYQVRFPGTITKLMSYEESETVKLALNSLFAIKVAAFNEIYQFCKASGLNYETVREGILADGRITAHHTKVPGPDGKTGFGNKCLPKDLKTWIHCLQEARVATWMAQAADTRNRMIDRKEGGIQ